MLRGIHKATANWMGRIITGLVLGVIAISFAIWGVGDMFRGYGRSTIAKIGSTEIGVEQFRQALNDGLQQVARNIGRPIPTEEARARGLDRQMLGKMLTEAAFDNNAQSLRLAMSNKQMADRITANPNFRGPTGQFDRQRFEAIIREMRYTEGRFIDEQRRLSLRRQIAETITGGLVVPAATLEMQHRYENEERKIDYIVLGAAQAGNIPDPSPEILAAYFDKNKAIFRSPETRKLSVLTVTPATIAPWIEISDADLQKAYDERKHSYTTPERREIQQIVFPNAEEARAASERIKGGMTFAQLIADRKLKESDVNLGMATKSMILDPKVADAAFALPSNGTSDPVEGRFGTVLVHVGAIEPEKVRPLAEVSAELKRELATSRARAQVTAQYDKIEDERGGGTPLTQIAEKLQLTPRIIEAVDRSGRSADGQPIPDLPQGVDLVSAAFASDVGIENDPLKDPAGGYVWFDVISTAPARDRPLDEVREKVIERWRQDEMTTRLKAQATTLIEQLKSKSMNDIATEAGVKAQSASGIKRGKPPIGIPAGVADEVFRVAKGGDGNVEGDKPGERYIFRVTDSTVPAFDPASAESKRQAETLRTAHVEELLTQYVTQLETELGTTINENALSQVLGGSAN